VEVNYKASIVALRVAESREGIRYLGAQLGHPVTGDIHSVTWSSRLGVPRKIDDLSA
jgi:hypothetical protein